MGYWFIRPECSCKGNDPRKPRISDSSIEYVDTYIYRYDYGLIWFYDGGECDGDFNKCRYLGKCFNNLPKPVRFLFVEVFVDNPFED